MSQVTIITGIYNNSNTLHEALDSIINQTFTDWQMILCDDGSSDNTYEIAQQYAEKYPEKFVVIKNEKNMGLNVTLNRCLSLATGKYIARMDGDDISLPERLQKEYDFLENNPEYSIVSVPMKYFDDNGVFMEGRGGKVPNPNMLPRGTIIPHAPSMVKKEAFDAVGGYSEDKKLLRVEDWHLWIKMYSLGYKAYILDQALYMMRDDRNAFSRRKFKYRLNESYVSRVAVKSLGLSPINYIFALRPILVGLLPKPIYKLLHKR